MKELEILAHSPEEAREKASAKNKIAPEFLEIVEEYEPDDQDLAEYTKENSLDAPPSTEELSLYVIHVAAQHYVKLAQDWTQGMIERFAPGATAEAIKFRHLIIVRLQVPESSILIGKGGATLDALQHVVVRALLSRDENFPDVMLDVERYREKKLLRLEKEARQAADKALRTGRKIPLSPMSPAERKFIHNTLKDIQGLKTESRGKDETRHIVVESTNPVPVRPPSRGPGGPGGPGRGPGGPGRGPGGGGRGGFQQRGGGSRPGGNPNRAGGGGNRVWEGNRADGPPREADGNRVEGYRDRDGNRAEIGNRADGPPRGRDGNRGGGGNRGGANPGNRQPPLPPNITDAQRKLLYGGLPKDDFNESDIEQRRASDLPRYTPPPETDRDEKKKFDDEIE